MLSTNFISAFTMSVAFLKSLLTMGPPSSGIEIVQISHTSSDAERSGLSPVLAASAVLSTPSGSFYIDQNAMCGMDIKLPHGLYPATVVVVTENISVESVKATLQRFADVDDVFDSNFLGFVIFSCSSPTICRLSDALTEFLGSTGTALVGFIPLDPPHQEALTEGPYFASAQGLFRAWKLVTDTQGAFVSALVETSSQRLTHLNASCSEAAPNLAIAVPSRLYYPSDPNKPLNGLRVGVKDNIDVAGSLTTGSSRAYAELYGISSSSAPATQKLLDLGAVIVGKTGMSQFADAEDPTGDFVDFLAPRNPRGDGQRSAGGSSYGSGAAAGAYSWLDFTIATDTGGSVRQPAAHQAVFGLRPTKGTMSLEGTLVIHRDLDTIGIISPDLETLGEVAKHFYDSSAPDKADLIDKKPPPVFLYPNHLFPVADDSAQQIYDRVAEALETVLGVQRTAVDFNELWQSNQTTEEPFEDYFAPLLYQYVVWGQYHERAEFRANYRTKFGREPYLNPLAQFRQKQGTELSEEQFEIIQTKRIQFQDFIESIYGENSIMLTPFKFGEPDAHDVYRAAPPLRDPAEFGWGLRPAFQAPFAAQPELVFPVGQLPSSCSLDRPSEYYGVVASLLGTKGTDMFIIEVAGKVLDSLGLPRKVLTGKYPYAK